MVDLEEVQRQARKELREEQHRAAVEAAKEKLRNKGSFWRSVLVKTGEAYRRVVTG